MRTPMNMRNLVDGTNVVPQGIINPEDSRQVAHNIEHVIKYLHSPDFVRTIEGIAQRLIDQSLANQTGQ